MDTLANERAPKAFIKPIPSCGNTKQKNSRNHSNGRRTKLKNAANASQDRDRLTNLLKNIYAQIYRDQLNKGKLIVAPLVEHCRNNKHMSNGGVTKNALWIFCQTEEETTLIRGTSQIKMYW